MAHLAIHLSVLVVWVDDVRRPASPGEGLLARFEEVEDVDDSEDESEDEESSPPGELPIIEDDFEEVVNNILGPAVQTHRTSNIEASCRLSAVGCRLSAVDSQSVPAPSIAQFFSEKSSMYNSA